MNTATTEHVIFRYDPGRQPSVCYRSIPHGCIGEAATLQDARDRIGRR